MSNKRINQYSFDGRLIESFESAALAEATTKISSSNILKVCKGKRSSAGGYIWEYSEFQNSCPQTSKETSEMSRGHNLENDTIQSSVVTTFESLNVEDLAALHKIDLNNYKISNYWSKLRPDGKFTSSILAARRNLSDKVDVSELKEITKGIISSYVQPVYFSSGKKHDVGKAIMFCIADAHIGCSNDNSLYENNWDSFEYRKRRLKVIDSLEEEIRSHGDFSKAIFVNLGDTMDGFNGQTTRGGHTLPQNMTNKEAIQTYAKVEFEFWDILMNKFPTLCFEQYDMENSNHSGNGWDSAANLVVSTYLEAKYPNRIKVTSETGLIASFKYGKNNIIYTHGKDEKYMKSPYPLNLNDQTETKIKQWMDLNGIHFNKEENFLFIKGDIHKYNYNEGKFVDYINCPSIMGSTDWIMHNFGLSKPGIFYAILQEDGSNIKQSIIRF